MAITALDTHQTVKELTAAGFSDAQAEALTQALRQVQNIDLSNLATKADVAEMATRSDIADVRREISDVKSELLKWFIGVAFAQAALVLAVIKLFSGPHL